MIKQEWKGKGFFSYGNTQSRGNAILFNPKTDFTIHRTQIDPGGNWIVLDLEMISLRFTLISLYGPNEDSPDFFDNIGKMITDFNNPHVILCGDWNLTQDQAIDNCNYLHVNNPRAKKAV